MTTIILWSVNLILIILCLILRRRIKFLPLIFLTIFVTLFSLLTPNGLVIHKFSFFDFRITQGALITGLTKSAVLILMHLVSKIFITSKIKFPGKIGKFINDTFCYYNLLTDSLGTQIYPEKNIFTKIDNRLCEIWTKEFAQG